MRCFIYYKRGPFSGMLEIGVNGSNDPKINIERAKLERQGATVFRVEVW